MDFLNKHAPNLIPKKEILDIIPRKYLPQTKLGIISETFRPKVEDYEHFDDFKIELELWNQENFPYIGDRAKKESDRISQMIDSRNKKIKSATDIEFREK